MTARDIMLLIRIIFFGSLLGNTFDAFPTRLRGQKAKAGIQIVDLEGLTDPVCIKLLTDNQQLVDAVRITE